MADQWHECRNHINCGEFAEVAGGYCKGCEEELEDLQPSYSSKQVKDLIDAAKAIVSTAPTDITTASIRSLDKALKAMGQ